MCMIIRCEREKPLSWPLNTAPPLPTTLFDKGFLVVQNDVEGLCYSTTSPPRHLRFCLYRPCLSLLIEAKAWEFYLPNFVQE